jgi:hypothetical protein
LKDYNPNAFTNILRKEINMILTPPHVILDMSDEFRCAISNKILANPVGSKKCNHLFEQAELEKYLEQHDRCPKKNCGKKIQLINGPKGLKERILKSFKYETVVEVGKRTLNGVTNGAISCVVANELARSFEIGDPSFGQIITMVSGVSIAVFSLLLLRKRTNSSLDKVKAFIMGTYGTALWFGGALTTHFCYNDEKNDDAMNHMTQSLLAWMVYSRSSVHTEIDICDLE